MLYPGRGEPRLSGARHAVEPGYYRLRARARASARLWSRRPSRSRRSRCSTPDEALDAEREPPAAAARAGGARRRGRDAPAELVLAADQFIITPAGRTEEAARARASGDEVRTVIAGYHWFTDWGRDTMISLEGLTLVTGRDVEAGYILRTFAHYVRDGLIPNMFPEGEKEGLYHTADATLWFFHAVSSLHALHERPAHARDAVSDAEEDRRRRTSAARGSASTSTRAIGLLAQGAPGYQLTWMDAKVDDWVVTPRRGKAVEINALWYNALRLMEQWAGEHGRSRSPGLPRARRHGSGSRSTSGSGTRAAATCTTSSTPSMAALAATTRSAGRTRCWPFRSPHPGARPERWEPVMRTVERAAADAGRPAVAGARRSRLQAALLRRPAHARRGVPPGHRVGLARRPVRRRVAEGVSRRRRGRAPARSKGSSRTSTTRASDRSARSSTPSRRSRRAAASLRRGASPKCSRVS